MKTACENNETIKKDSLKGDFLQSKEWREFQQSTGRKTYHIGNDAPASLADKFSASIIEHALPIVGKYFYCPRGPIISPEGEKAPISNEQIKHGMQELINLAKKENAGWIRIDCENEEALNLMKENISEKIVKAPHDMQPKEIFVLDISRTHEQLLGEMKPKTRYNINLASKKELKISTGHEYLDDFLRLTKEMAARQGISAHPEAYYRKMTESFPEEMLKIYAAEFEGQVIAANLVLFYGKTATYLHGASGNQHRNLMAPFLLQWQSILDAKETGCKRYDFGGVKTNSSDSSWAGITQFKLGFSPSTKPVEFSGSYDIIINPRKYAVYRGLQRAKAFAVKFRK